MLSQLTVDQLKMELESRGLDTTGKKAELVARLEAVLAEESTKEKNNQNADDSDSNSTTTITEETQGQKEQHKRTNGKTNINNYSPEFKVSDIENLIQKFNGDGRIQIKTWIKEFEEIATMLNWTEVEKFIYAKRHLSGSAQIFCRTITCISYTNLKTYLIREFQEKICKADIYFILFFFFMWPSSA